MTGIRSTRLATAFAALLLCVSCASLTGLETNDRKPAATQAIESARNIITASRQESTAPAIAASVWHRDNIVWSEAFGLADLEHRVPASSESLFRLGSVAKALTASLVARLADRGVVDLDADIRETLPVFPDKGKPISLRQLLGHLGGIRHYTAKDFDPSLPGGVINTRRYPDDASILALFADDPLVAPPGTAFSYSTFGYTLIQLVLEAATGREYYDLLNEYLLQPAGAGNVLLDDWFAIIPNRVDYYDPIDVYQGYLPPEYGPVVNSSPLNSAYKRAGGGLIGTADDIARIGALHVAPGFLSETMFAQVFTSQKNAAGQETGTGLGWRIGKDDAGRTFYHHRGSQQGCRAYVLVYPEQQLVVSILSNLAYRPADIQKTAQDVAAGFME